MRLALYVREYFARALQVGGRKDRFKKFLREPILVQIESGLRVDITLPVGAQTETVEVTSEVPFLQPERARWGKWSNSERSLSCR